MTSFIRNARVLLPVFVLLSMPACGLSSDGSDGPNGPSDLGPQAPAAQEPKPLIFGLDSESGSLQNSASSSDHEIDTGWTVHAGDQFEIFPTCIDRERRAAPQPVVTRTDNSVCVNQVEVCVATQPIFQSSCISYCLPCLKCDMPEFCTQSHCCKTKCKDTQIGTQCIRKEMHCVQSQDQWQETTQYGPLGAATYDKNKTPMTDVALMLAGLKLKLIFSGDQTPDSETSYPISQFNPKINLDRIVLTLGDKKGSAGGFATHPGQTARLSVINEMNEPIHYSQGAQVKSWDGKLLEQAIDQTYSPEINFEGTISPLSGVSTQ